MTDDGEDLRIHLPEDVSDIWRAEEKTRQYTASGCVLKILHDLDPTERRIVEESCETMWIRFCIKQSFPNEGLLTKLATVLWDDSHEKAKTSKGKQVNLSRQILTIFKPSVCFAITQFIFKCNQLLTDYVELDTNKPEKIKRKRSFLMMSRLYFGPPEIRQKCNWKFQVQKILS